jgi:pyrroloquinoline quinone biosynthesis protein B
VNCAAARAGKISPQIQSSVAISGDGRSWFLVNASADLARQIKATPALQPRGGRSRSSAVVNILLTNVELDHVLGLLSLRQQSEPIVVYANERIRAALEWKQASYAPILSPSDP